MLRELHITNLAVIADAKVELASGLNCFTGATGAGKSLVIGAIELLLGLRSAGEMLRTGVDEARVSGIFDISSKESLKRIEAVTDLPITEDGGEILLTRRLHASGRSSISLNGNPITLGMLKLVAEQLIDVHGQHDHQYLLKPSNQLEVLDQFAGCEALRDEYHRAYSELQQAKEKLAELTASRTLREQQLELYRFQAGEIDGAELTPGEYEEISARAGLLKNLEKLTREVTATHSALYEADGSLLERLKMMAAVLSELTLLDQNLGPISQNLRDATISLEEVAFDLSRYLDRLDLDPSEAAEVEDRLNVLHRILSKYGGTAEAVLAHREELAKDIAELEMASDDLAAVDKAIRPLEAQVEKLGRELTTKRKAAAATLCPQIERELAELGMEKAKFTASFTPLPHASPFGFDQMEFMAQTNPGQLAQPLRKVASGGEMSRIMLALKGIFAQGDRVSVLVFDEIDANVGGRLGSIIGSKLRRLAALHQVLCITHLPQIASYADRHLTVRKEVRGDQTQTSVSLVDGASRIEELAEMIGGQRITETTRHQARELIDTAMSEPVKVAPALSGRVKSRGAKTVRS
ncbi:MAG TPA: DNA repair protein RecN [Tepidisphaeraceae bacterium]|jgi:DNA repair protein RecN (Recombination protein N)